MFHKMFCRLAVLAAVAMLVVVAADSSAFAQSKRFGKRPTLSKEEMLKKYDTDGDGKLDDKETKAMKDDQAKEAAPNNPAAGDQNPEAGPPRRGAGGFGGPGGFGGRGGADMEARRAEFEKRFDKNGDGKLDDEEKASLEEARKKFAGGRGQGGPGGPGAPGRFSGPEAEARRAEFMKKYDTNGNGQIDEDERAAMQKDMPARGGPAGAGGPGGRGGFGGPEGKARRAEMLKKYDKDRDGQLDDDERAAMRKDLPVGGAGGFRGKRPESK